MWVSLQFLHFVIPCIATIENILEWFWHKPTLHLELLLLAYYTVNPHYSLNSTLSSVRKSKSKVLLTTGKSQYKEWENWNKQTAKNSLNQDFYLVVVGKSNLVIKENFEEWKSLKSRLACSIEAWEVGLLPKTFSLLLRRDQMFSTRSISSFLWVKKPIFYRFFPPCVLWLDKQMYSALSI